MAIPINLILEAALDSAPFAFAPDWETISSGIISFEVSYGRNYKLDRMEAGECTIRLLNLDGHLDPDYPSGPYYGRIDIGKEFRLSYEIGGTTTPIFTGFLRYLPRTFPGFFGDEVELKLVDAFLRLAKHKITTDEGADFPEESSGDRITRVLDLAGFPDDSGPPPAIHRSIDAGNSDVASVGLAARPALEHILHVEQTEFGLFYISPSGMATFVGRHELLSSDIYINSQATFGGQYGIPYEELIPEYGEDLLYNTVQASRVGSDAEDTVATDATSVTNYGSSTLDRGELLCTTDTELETLCYYLLDRHKRPQVRFKSLRVFANRDMGTFLTVMALVLKGRVTVDLVNRRLGYTTSKEVQIEKITHSYDLRTLKWEWTAQLSDTDINTYWILADTTFGVLNVTTVWGF